MQEELVSKIDSQQTTSTTNDYISQVHPWFQTPIQP
jgi:hypothetical protein